MQDQTLTAPLFREFSSTVFVSFSYLLDKFVGFSTGGTLFSLFDCWIEFGYWLFCCFRWFVMQFGSVLLSKIMSLFDFAMSG